MAGTITDLIQYGKIKASHLLVKVVQQIGPHTFLIADSSDVALLNTSQSESHSKLLIEGCSYKLIKCSRGEANEIVTNKNFKPVKSLLKVEVGDISTKMKIIQDSVVKNTDNTKYVDFDEVEKKPIHAKIEKLTVKVISKSRTITTKKGNYQICTIKDFKGRKANF